MDKSCSIVIAGGPDTGKTNYIIGLWLAMRDNANNNLLQSNGIPPDLDYLEEGVRFLLDGQFAPHTPYDVSVSTSIPFRYSGSTEEIRGKLTVPDRSGEQWLNVYWKRTWSEVWEEQISQSCGCLLFIRADSDQFVPSLDWISCERLYGGPLGGIVQPENKSEAPSEAVIVEWLQFLREAFTHYQGGFFRPRVGLIIAAWDLVPLDQQERSATDYVEANLPMLYQFTLANQDTFEFKFFGVSVTGGDLNKKEFRDEYFDTDPARRGFVVYEGEAGSIIKKHDLTLPVVWVLGESI